MVGRAGIDPSPPSSEVKVAVRADQATSADPLVGPSADLVGLHDSRLLLKNPDSEEIRGIPAGNFES